MNRLLKIYRNAEATDASGGVAPVSTPQTDLSQSASAGSPSPGASEGQPSVAAGSAGETKYTQEFFEKLESLKSHELGEVTDSDVEAYNKWNSTGRKAPSPPSKPVSKVAEEVAPGSVETPKTDADIQKIIEEKGSNKWTAEEAEAIAKAMESVGAKTPQELLAKNKEALALAGRKGQEAGNLQRDLDQHTMFLSDLAEGKPGAIRFLQKLNPNLTLAQVQAAVAAPQKPTASEGEIPEGVIDEAGFRHLKSTMDSLRAENAEMKELLMNTVNQQKQAVQQQQELAQQNEMRQGYIEQALQLASQYPDEFQVQSGNLRSLLHKHYYEGKTDPRLQNFLSLAQYAYDEGHFNQKTGLFDLPRAYLAKNQETLSAKLIAAKKLGREEVLNTGRSQGLAAVRNNPSGGNPAQITEADAHAMNRGDKEAPKEWWTNGIVDRSKVPEHLHKIIFGRSR